MDQQFVDRELELKFLEERYRESSPQLIIVYGRRRIGKTELLLRFARDKPHVYFLCERTNMRSNIFKMSLRMAKYLNRDSFSRIEFRDWEDLFVEFLEWKGGEKVIIIVDEFPYLIELNKGVISEFQRIWDEHVSKRMDVMLVLCGSSVGMMETEVLGYRSPLYGRRTGQWKVGELNLGSVWKFIPSYPLKEVIYTYGALGGVPAYLIKLNSKLSFHENVKRLVLSKEGVLYEEAENLLRQELREPRNYTMILRALSEGKRRVTEIAKEIGMDRAAVSRYLDVLEALDIVGYETPLLERPKTRKRFYYIKDNYFNFWFRYVYPNKDLIEEGKGDLVIEELAKDYDTYIGPVYERIIRSLIYELNLPFIISRSGRHWGKTGKGEAYEIDILAHDRDKRNFLLLEVKWSDLTFKDALRILHSLEENAEKAGIYGKLYYGIVGRHISMKEKLRKKGYTAIDLKDIEKSLKKVPKP